MKKEKIEELFNSNSNERNEMNSDDFTNAINQSELEWYKKLLGKLEFIYGSDLKVYGTIIDKNANNYYNEIQDKIKELEK